MCRFAYKQDMVEKIGNAMVYILNSTQNTSKTKLIKLLYFIEEHSVKKYKIPFFDIPFEVWQAGPVPKSIYIDINDGLEIFGKFISKEYRKETGYGCLVAVQEFCDDEFSENEIELMNTVIKKYGDKTATELVSLSHSKDSAWYHIASENDLINSFENGCANSSNFEIDMTFYLSGCDAEMYREQQEFNTIASYLN
jgi:uncharacterized phage-associated protein